MIIIRPITAKDTADFIKLAFEAGIGMTSMPKNPELLEKRVLDSEKAFKDATFAFKHGSYLFVLEDLKTGIIGGTCGIVPKTGRSSPLIFYKNKYLEQHTSIGLPPQETPILHVIQHKNYWSEVCSLYLTKEYRHSGFGRLLSLSRFLFIATFPERFDTKIFAEMRGHVDENKGSPFWEGIGRHFVDTTFETLMDLRDKGEVDLSEALPLHPIYIHLLPKHVQETIGRTHDETKPALQMLTEEGFKLSEEFDICDGGPKIEAEIHKIRTIQESKLEIITEITTETFSSPPFLLSNTHINFKACLSPLEKHPNGGIVISQEVAEALDVTKGDYIRYVSIYKK